MASSTPTTNIKTTTDWFRSAAPYIHAHRGATFVIALDGNTVADEGFSSLIHDIALLNSLGIKLIITFGARQQIATACEAAGVVTEYHQDLRVTDDASLAIAINVIGTLKTQIQAQFSFGLPNTSMSDAKIRCTSGNFITAQPMGIKEGIDFQHTGKVRKVDIEGIQAQLEQENIVLLGPLGYSSTGEVFNLSSEAIATEVAIKMKADKLIFIGDMAVDIARELTLPQAKELLETDSNHLLLSATTACDAGVNRVHLIDRSLDGALLQELFSHDGVGTLVSKNPFENTRPATEHDIGGILELIEPLEVNGTLVHRSREHLGSEIEFFTVMERDNSIIACAALYHYPDCDTAELACLAVAPSYRDAGRGEYLFKNVESQAREAGVTNLCVLTTQSSHWFLEHGFKEAAIDELPMEKQALYNYQRNAKVFKKVLGNT
ncbi:MAG: amino-acid N-acetyltransferase [Methylophaga sp.]|nr:MAG: amino-acid N-acetyltransferase [Methylophaga sp.]